MSFTPLGGAEAPPRQVRIDAASKTIADIKNIGSMILAGTSVTGSASNVVNVQITNNLGKDVTVTDWKAVYSPFDATTGPFYDEFKIGGTAHWSSTSPKAGSGSLLSSIATLTSYLFSNSTTITFTMFNFEDNLAANQNMTGFAFTVTLYLSSGAIYVFTFSA